jgi:polyhydroxyalkanoate synthesis regulator phasin
MLYNVLKAITKMKIRASQIGKLMATPRSKGESLSQTAKTYIQELVKQKKVEKEHILRAYDIGSNEGYDLAKIDEIEEGHYMKEPIEYYKETFKSE